MEGGTCFSNLVWVKTLNKPFGMMKKLLFGKKKKCPFQAPERGDVMLLIPDLQGLFLLTFWAQDSRAKWGKSWISFTFLNFWTTREWRCKLPASHLPSWSWRWKKCSRGTWDIASNKDSATCHWPLEQEAITSTVVESWQRCKDMWSPPFHGVSWWKLKSYQDYFWPGMFTVSSRLL